MAAFKSSMAEFGRLECACEPVPDDICAEEYNSTIFPNKVNGFSSGADALKEFQSFPVEVLALEDCSSMLVKFLCSYYFPPCMRDLDCEAIGPCDSLCEMVRSGCEPLLLRRNQTWPDNLNCSKFPKLESTDSFCIAGTPAVAVTVESPCEKVKQPHCAALHADYMTQFPNKDFTSQDEADKQFNSFVGAFSSNCSTMLKEFLCTSHYPVCTKSEDYPQIYPCKHMCEEVRTGCESYLLQHNVSWPEFLNCSKFLDKNENLCIDSAFTAPSTPPVTNVSVALPPIDTCEPILPEVLEICGDIHPNYNMTHFPYGQFTSQKEAIDTLKNSTDYLPYLELIEKNCAAELKPFLCLHFFPSCSPTQPEIPIKPCRRVCRKARNKCSDCLTEPSKWDFDCDYETHGACIGHEDLDLSSKETKC